MSKSSWVIHIQPDAPAKPMLGAPCNGCGVCCQIEPCPVGRLLSGRIRGACKALVWQAEALHYRCGALTQPRLQLMRCLPTAWHWSVGFLAWLLRRAGRRWIAAGVGCDCDVSVKEKVDGSSF